MTHQEILNKAIEQAITNGWDFNGLLAPMDPGKYEVIAPFGGNYLRIKLTSGLGNEEWFESINAVIYDHGFARALWGEEERSNPYLVPKAERGGHFTGNSFSGNLFEIITNKGWKRHLQEMVVADDAIAYLGEHLT